MIKMSIGLLIAVTFITGCQSTAEVEQVNVATDNQSKTSQVSSVTEAKRASNEVSTLVESDFTDKQLKLAAKELGYRCSMEALTGTRIKKKVCSTEQQRAVLARALRDSLRGQKYGKSDTAVSGM